jgi:hypothetical protein
MRITTSVLEGVPKLLSSWPDIFGSYEAAGTIQHTVMQITPTAALGLDTNERKREEELSRLALAWATLAHLESNFLKSEYQQNFAAKHTSKILGTLNREWLEAYRRVLGDPELYTIIQDQHPHVLDFLEVRLEVIRIAERLAIEPASPPPAPEPKPKVIPDELRGRIERYWQRFLTRKRVNVYTPEQLRRHHTRPQRDTDVVRARSVRHRPCLALLAALVVVSLLGAGALWQSPLMRHKLKEYMTGLGQRSTDLVQPSPAYREPPLLPQSPAYREPPLLPQSPAYREPPLLPQSPAYREPPPSHRSR